jgi:alpha-beta hydrolase superfamily lysophospholipase
MPIYSSPEESDERCVYQFTPTIGLIFYDEMKAAKENIKTLELPILVFQATDEDVVCNKAMK